MGLQLVTAPLFEPVTRDQVKLHCRITDDSQDSRVDRFIRSARSYAENRLGRQLLNATWKLTLDKFPDANGKGSLGQIILIPRPPLASVTSIQYLDGNGDLQTWSSSYYVVDSESEPGRIQVKPSSSWPNTIDYLNAVRITFVAGYGSDVSFVPADIRHAIEMLAAHYYENREAVMASGSRADGRWLEVPLAVNDLLDLHRVDQYIYP